MKEIAIKQRKEWNHNETNEIAMKQHLEKKRKEITMKQYLGKEWNCNETIPRKEMKLQRNSIASVSFTCQAISYH